MSFIPKIEKITKDATIVHFFLMFGYKTFSLYFPVFLIARGLSLPEVGYSYLLIYLPLSLFAPIAGHLNHKINPATLAAIGILGYAIYALGMILIQSPVLFYFWQVLLGISAALFFVSIRAILMGYPLENSDRSFGWFYSAPFYADAIAPAIGAFFIWKFGFVGVF
ncbi:MAG: MFS transporter, partial [Ignavibacteria bacterium]|nr:MFS transporter [Ignavibacteria bacterium]